jgi:hypothetical protein
LVGARTLPHALGHGNARTCNASAPPRCWRKILRLSRTHGHLLSVT